MNSNFNGNFVSFKLLGASTIFKHYKCSSWPSIPSSIPTLKLHRILRPHFQPLTSLPNQSQLEPSLFRFLRFCCVYFPARSTARKTIFLIEHDSVTMKWKDTFIVYDWWTVWGWPACLWKREAPICLFCVYLGLPFRRCTLRDPTGFSLVSSSEND